MRVALISLAGQPRGAEGAAVTIAGRTLALHQAQFALAAGATGVVALGDGAGAEALALRHAVERGGARYQTIRDSHGLLGLVRAADELLVLTPGLLAQAPEALMALSGAPTVLVLPAGAGVTAGFERIDLERAWAGALVVPGNLVERLAELAPESDPAPALLRIALQSGVGERSLPAGVLAHGTWTLLSAERAAALERDWLERHVPAADRFAVSEHAVRAGMRRWAPRLLQSKRAAFALNSAPPVLVAGAGALAALWSPAAGLAVTGVAALVATAATSLAHVHAAPFGAPSARLAWRSAQGWLIDAALGFCGVLAMDGSWLQRLFPPLVLIAILRAGNPAGASSPAALVADRAPLAFGLAVGAALGLAEPAIMLVALVLLVGNAVGSRSAHG